MQKNGIKGYLVVVNCMSRGQRLTAEVVDNQCQSVLSVEESNKRAKEAVFSPGRGLPGFPQEKTEMAH